MEASNDFEDEDWADFEGPSEALEPTTTPLVHDDFDQEAKDEDPPVVDTPITLHETIVPHTIIDGSINQYSKEISDEGMDVFETFVSTEISRPIADAPIQDPFDFFDETSLNPAVQINKPAAKETSVIIDPIIAGAEIIENKEADPQFKTTDEILCGNDDNETTSNLHEVDPFIDVDRDVDNADADASASFESSSLQLTANIGDHSSMRDVDEIPTKIEESVTDIDPFEGIIDENSYELTSLPIPSVSVIPLEVSDTVNDSPDRNQMTSLGQDESSLLSQVAAIMIDDVFASLIDDRPLTSSQHDFMSTSLMNQSVVEEDPFSSLLTQESQPGLVDPLIEDNVASFDSLTILPSTIDEGDEVVIEPSAMDMSDAAAVSDHVETPVKIDEYYITEVQDPLVMEVGRVDDFIVKNDSVIDDNITPETQEVTALTEEVGEDDDWGDFDAADPPTIESTVTPQVTKEAPIDDDWDNFEGPQSIGEDVKIASAVALENNLQIPSTDAYTSAGLLEDSDDIVLAGITAMNLISLKVTGDLRRNYD